MQCGARAQASRADERERLLKMRQALLDLAENEDWLSGRIRSQGAETQIANRDAALRALSRTG
jgi:hypothetical protein